MVDPILQPDGYSEDAATEAAAMAQDYQASPETANEQDYPDVFLILSESFYDFDLVTDLQADQEIMQVTKTCPTPFTATPSARMWAAAPTPASTRCFPPTR